MPKFQFTFNVTGLDPDDEQQLSALDRAFNDGVDEWFAEKGCGRTRICFYDQSAATGIAALKNAHKKLKKALPEVQVLYVGDDLVNLADIAERADIDKKEIRRLIKKERFPAVWEILGDGTCVWRWQDVRDTLNPQDEDRSQFVDRQAVAAFTIFLDIEQRRAPYAAQSRHGTIKETPLLPETTTCLHTVSH